MTIATGSMQWRCCVCNAAKPVGTGGICARCRKFACNRHLNRVLLDEKQRERVCTACLTGEDKLETGLRGLLEKWLA